MEVMLLLAGILFVLFGIDYANGLQRQDEKTKHVNEHPEFYQEVKRSDLSSHALPCHDGKFYHYVGERYVSPEAQAVINHESKRLA